MTGILSQYMMRTILASTALVLVVLLALAGIAPGCCSLPLLPRSNLT